MKKRALKIPIKTILFLIFVFLILFSFYLRSLFKQLDVNFNKEEEFTPTRIYSDVFKVAPPLHHEQLLTRLKNLNYKTTLSNKPSEGSTIEINLHSSDYPLELLPKDHITQKLMNEKIIFRFHSSQPSAELESIEAQVGGAMEVIPEIYLEPQIVATFGKSDLASKREIRKVLNFDDIPASVWQSILSVEDPRFLEHKGIDPRGLVRAILVNLKTGSFSQGGSTITAQLVKNLMERHSKNIFKKLNELFLALILEVRYSKEEILTRYLNEVYLGQAGGYEVHGVSEGAELFFGKEISELNLGEIALMAGLIRGPGFYSPYKYFKRAKERQEFVLKRMMEAGYIADGERKEAMGLPLRLAPPITATSKAPFFIDYVKAELIKKLKDAGSSIDITSAGYKVYTTLDPVLNEMAQNAVFNGVNRIQSLFPDEPLEGALASVENSTGYIRTLVGGKNYSQNQFNRILNMKRQVGSTFKPFVYLAAFLNGKDENGIPYSTGYPVEDKLWTLTFDEGRQKWTPKNYDKDFNGWLPLRLALAKSLNTVTSKLATQIGVSAVIEAARLAGIESELPDVPSLSLGVAELSPVELLSAYSTIANFGKQDELTVIRMITEPSGKIFARFVSEPKEMIPHAPTSLLIKTMTSVFSEGTASGVHFEIPAAGKTGTTSNYRDAWFAGFTPDLTTVVWTGIDQNGPNGNTVSKKKKLQITGASSALPIWVDFMKKASEGLEKKEFNFSNDLIEQTIDSRTGKLLGSGCPASQSIQAFFMKDQVPSDSSCESKYPESVTEIKK